MTQKRRLYGAVSQPATPAARIKLADSMELAGRAQLWCSAAIGDASRLLLHRGRSRPRDGGEAEVIGHSSRFSEATERCQLSR